MEKEAFAILKGLNHFRSIILNSFIRIFTDNSNILFKKQIESRRVLRWRYLLNEFDYEISHVDGKSNNAADYLSRLYSVKDTTVYDYERIASWQRAHNISGKKIVIDDITLEATETHQIIIPEPKFKEFFLKYHEILGHPGSNRFYKTFKDFFKVKNMSKHVHLLTESCNYCAYNKTIKVKVLIKNQFKANQFNEIVCSDIVGPFDTSNYRGSIISDKFYIVTYIDIFSRYLQVYVINDITSDSLVRTLKNYISEFGACKRLHTDNGLQYNSNKFAKLCLENNIRHTTTPGYTPQANGVAERINYSIKNIMRIYLDHDIEFILTRITNNQTHLRHSALGCSPYEKIFKYCFLDPLRREISIIDKVGNSHKKEEDRTINDSFIKKLKSNQ